MLLTTSFIYSSKDLTLDHIEWLWGPVKEGRIMRDVSLTSVTSSKMLPSVTVDRDIKSMWLDNFQVQHSVKFPVWLSVCFSNG